MSELLRDPQSQKDEQNQHKADNQSSVSAEPAQQSNPLRDFAKKTIPRRLQQSALMHMQRRFGNAYVQRRLAQSDMQLQQEEEGDAAVPLIVDDDADTLQPGQMRKSQFLDQLREAVCATADEALSGTMYSAIGCPYIERVFSRLPGRSAAYIERGLRRYAPSAAGATAAVEYITPVKSRVRAGIMTWLETGQVAGVPESLTGLGSGIESPAPSQNETNTQADISLQRAIDPRQLQDQLGNGMPLQGSTRTRMESGFKQSFSDVRVHTGGRASQLAREEDARAFTVGRDIVFADGEYRPGTLVGDAILAHEMAHAVQQRGAASHSGHVQRADSTYNALEKDANLSAFGAIASLWGGAQRTLDDIELNAMPRMTSGLALQRCGGRKKASVRGANLKEALGFESRLETAAAEAKAMHPMTASIVRRMKELLEAQVVEGNDEKAKALYGSLKGTMGNLSETIRRMGDRAPDRFLWSQEEAAWSYLLSKIDSGFFGAYMGTWSEGSEEVWMNALIAVDKRLINSMMSPNTGPAQIISPGGKISQKIPIGSIPLPSALLNIYLNLEIAKKGEASGGAEAAASAEIDEDGKLKPGVSTSVEGPGGSKASAGVGSDGPSVSAETGKLKSGLSSVSGVGKMSAQGSEVGLKAEDPGGWSWELNSKSDGSISYKIEHPSGSGISLSGQIDKFSLQAMAPTATLGDTSVKASIEMELIPAPLFWPKTLTQNEDMLEFWNDYKTVVLVLAGATIAAPFVASAELPAVSITLGRAAPALVF